MTLQRLILTYTRDGVEARVLYRSEATAGAGPGTKVRRREVAELTREGLHQALQALDAGDVADLGTSGYAVREDVLGLAAASRDTRQLVKDGK